MDRFWSKVDMNPHHCWEWQAFRRPFGYGQFWFKGQDRNAHIVSYYLTYGPYAKVDFEGNTVEVRHKCDNPPCVRPDHLELGTHKQNMADSSLRGRATNQWASKTHCIYGHQFSGDNVAYRPKGGRVCKQCKRDMYYKLKEKKLADSHGDD